MYSSMMEKLIGRLGVQRSYGFTNSLRGCLDFVFWLRKWNQSL